MTIYALAVLALFPLVNAAAPDPKLAQCERLAADEEALDELALQSSGPILVTGTLALRAEHALSAAIDEANSAPRIKNKPLKSNSEEDLFRLRIAVGEYVAESAERIAAPEVKALLKKVADGEIADPRHDPRLAEYQSILEELLLNSKALHRIEQESAFYGELVGTNILRLNDIEKPEPFRIFTLRSWLKLIMSIIHRKPIAQYSFSQRFAHEMRILAPKTRLKTLKALLKRKKLPPITHAEAFTILGAFDGVDQRAVYDLLKKQIYTSLKIYAFDRISQSISKLEPPTITRILNENKLGLTMAGILRLADERPDLFHEVADKPSVWGLGDLRFEYDADIAPLLTPDKKFDQPTLEKLLIFLRSKSNEVQFLFKVIEADRAADRDGAIARLDHLITDRSASQTDVSHPHGSISKHALIRLLSISPDMLIQMISKKASWKIDYTLNDGDLESILSQQSAIPLACLHPLMNEMIPDAAVRKKLIMGLLENGLISKDEVFLVQAELAESLFAPRGTKVAAAAKALVASANEAESKAAFFALLPISSQTAIEIIQNPKLWNTRLTLGAEEVPLFTDALGKLGSEAITAICAAFSRTADRKAFLQRLAEHGLAAEPASLQAILEKLNEQQDLRSKKISIHDAIALAQTATTDNTRDAILAKVFEKHLGDLTIAQMIELASEVSVQRTANRMRTRYVAAKADALTTNDLLEISQDVTTYDAKDALITMYCNHRISDLEVSELVRMVDEMSSKSNRHEVLQKYAFFHFAKLKKDSILELIGSALTYPVRDSILEGYGSERIADLAIHEIIELADQAHEPRVKYLLVSKYLKTHVRDLSVENVIDLCENASTDDARDSMIRKFFDVRRGTLSASSLQTLADAANSSSLKNAILSSVAD